MGPARVWSLSTTTNARRGLVSDGTVHFASPVPVGLRGLPATPALPNFAEEDGVELESVPQLSLNDEWLLLPS